MDTNFKPSLPFLSGISGRFIFLSLFICFLFAGCEREEVTGGNHGNNVASGSLLTVNTSVQGFTGSPNDRSPGTRSAWITSKVSFNPGDKIGVFAVENGVVKEDGKNKPLTYKIGGKWEGDVYYYNDQTTYFAYFPYDAAYDNMTSLAQIQADFESKLGNNPGQSSSIEFMKYASMMVSTSTDGTANKAQKTLSFTFKPVGARVALYLPETLVCYSNGNSEDFTYSLRNVTGVVTPAEAVSGVTWKINDEESTFYEEEYVGIYNRIVKPGTTIKVEMSGIFTYPVGDQACMNMLSFKMENITTEMGKSRVVLLNLRRDLQPGDFLYEDGSFLPREVTNPPKDGCVAIVNSMKTFYKPNISDFSPRIDGRDEPPLQAIHGYAVALRNANGDNAAFHWASEKKKTGATKSCGYLDTRILLALTNMTPYAAKFAVENNGTPPPKGSSGWYLSSSLDPSWEPGELNLSLDKIGGQRIENRGYWMSSTSQEPSQPEYADFINPFGGVDRLYENRYSNLPARASVAF